MSYGGYHGSNTSRPRTRGLVKCQRCQALLGPTEVADRPDGDWCLPCAAREGRAPSASGHAFPPGGAPPLGGPTGPRPIGDAPFAGSPLGGGLATSAPVDVHASHAAVGTGLSPLRRQAFYARLLVIRRKLEERETFELHREAAELTETLSLPFEALEHARSWLRLRPGDPAAQRRVEKLARLNEATGVTGSAPGAAAPPERRPRGPEESAPFWSELGSVIAYPLRGRGAGILIVGGIFCGGANLIASFNWFAGAILLCLWGYVSAYQFDVIARTAAGRDDAPEFPEVLSLLESMVFPFFAYLGCLLAAFWPCLVIGIACTTGPVPMVVGAPLAILAFAVGFFVFPMTLLSRAMHQSVWPAFSPRFLYGSISRILPDYLAGFVVIGLVWFGHTLASIALTFLFTLAIGPPTPDALLVGDWSRVFAWVANTVLGWPVFLFALVLQGHVLGRLFRQGQRRLGWFHAPSADPRKPASGLSFALVIGALGAAVLGAAGFGGMLYFGTQMSASVAAPSRDCPVRNGSKLVYFFEDTDGPAGLVTYEFRKRADGLLDVTATTRMADRGPEDVIVEPVGAFDPDDGVFVEATRGYPGDARLAGTPSSDVPWYGTTSTAPGRTYLNDWLVRGRKPWRDHWDAWHVVDGSMDEYYFDSATGVLVGLRRVAIGHEERQWLVGAENVPVLEGRPFPRPNRTFLGD